MEKLISFFRPWLEIRASIPHKNLDLWEFAVAKQKTNDPTIRNEVPKSTGYLFHERIQFKDPQTGWNLCKFYVEMCRLHNKEPF